jgi:hypothetical protein
LLRIVGGSDGIGPKVALCVNHGRKTSEVSMIRQRLLDKGLVYATEDYGHVDFTVPRFGEFMARYMPYRAPRTPRKSGRTA